jgi:hypothetical protein
MQIAINGQSAQSTGDDFSGQQGMSSDMDAALDAASSVMAATAIDATGFALAPRRKRGKYEACNQKDRQQPAKVDRMFHGDRLRMIRPVMGSRVPSRKRGIY